MSSDNFFISLICVWHLMTILDQIRVVVIQDRDTSYGSFFPIMKSIDSSLHCLILDFGQFQLARNPKRVTDGRDMSL